MAKSQSNSSRSNGNQRGRNNNNAEGRNQYSGGVMDMAREQPIKAALGAAAAVGAGVFLWSRRNQISEQLGNLSDQIGEWTENMNFGGSDFSMGSSSDDTAGFATGEPIGKSGNKGRVGRTSHSTGSQPTMTRSTGEIDSNG